MSAPEEKGELREDFLRISKPEEIKICDPACGSGHMLVYAFDLLYAIYEEEGYEATEIPRLILENNLYGVEIDERARELAAFALVMKAREKYRRFFRKPVQPNICVLENITFEEGELKTYMDEIGCDLFTANLETTLHQFEEADNFGSLIRPALTNVTDVLRILKEKDVAGNLFLQNTHERVLQVLRQAEYLSGKYHLVVANPPYMGGRGMNGRLKKFAQDNYPDSKSDLFAMFVERIMDMVPKGGFIGLMTPFTWMFLSSYEKLRSRILNEYTLTNLVRPEYHAFFDSAYVPICGFTLFTRPLPQHAGAFIDLNDFYGVDIQSAKTLEAIQNPDCGWFYRASAADFKKIPGLPIAYWISDNAREAFVKFRSVEDVATAKQGLITGDNEQFLRFWSEVEWNSIGFGFTNRTTARNSSKKWYPHHKGGEFRKWYGNHDYIVDWENDGERIRGFVDENGKLRSRPQNLDYYFKPAITWTALTVTSFNGRISHGGFIYDAKGPLLHPYELKRLPILAGLLNSSVSNYLLKLLAPTMDYNQGPISRLPYQDIIEEQSNSLIPLVDRLECIAKNDWDSYETSWDFTDLPLLRDEFRRDTISAIYGGNASGKTNFFKALSFVKSLVVKGTQPEGMIPVEPFRLDPACSGIPSRFNFELLIDETIYAFSFAATQQAVVEERLVEVLSSSERTLYERADGEITFDDSLKNDLFFDFAFRGTRNNQLFLTNAVSQKIEKFLPVYKWFRDTLELVAPDSRFEPFEQFLQEEHPLYPVMNVTLSQLDTGIAHLGGEEIPFETLPLPEPLREKLQAEVKESVTIRFQAHPMNERFVITRKGRELVAKKLMTYHRRTDGTEAKFEMSQESDGSRRVIDLLPAFLDMTAADSSRVYVVDELDRSLHTLLTRQLLAGYLAACSKETRSQLLFTTHDVLLMDQKLMRRDEMWVTE